MTTDAPRSITDTLADLLAQHDARPMGESVHCRCGALFGGMDVYGARDNWKRHRIAVLAPVVAGMVTAAKAEAWDEGRASGLSDARPTRSRDMPRDNPYRAAAQEADHEPE